MVEMYYKVISVYILGFISILPEIWTTDNDTDSSTAIVYLDPDLIEGDVTHVAEKQGLRYGFQKTEPCKSFQASFICIRKCLDLGFDVAYADKKCKCTCYKKPGKSKYFPKLSNVTSWKKGPPTTIIPEWATPKKYTLPNTTFVDSSEEDDDSTKVSTKTAGENSTTVVNGNITSNIPTSETPISNTIVGSTVNSKATVSNYTITNATVTNATATTKH